MAEPLFELLFDDFANTDRRVANQKHYPQHREPEPETFDVETAREARDTALEQVEANANPEWSELFYSTLEQVAARMPEFTSDEVWEELAKLPNQPKQHEPRAAGPQVIRAIKAGVIRKADKMPKKSRRASCHHRPIAVYESLIYGDVNG